MSQNDRNLCVDGHEFRDSESNWAGDGQFPPFAVFDIDAQENLLPYYATRKQAEGAMSAMLKEQRNMNTSHLDAIRIRLSHERSRLSAAGSDSERELRASWVAGIERELTGELQFLGLPPDPQVGDIDGDALLAELANESQRG